MKRSARLFIYGLMCVVVFTGCASSGSNSDSHHQSSQSRTNDSQPKEKMGVLGIMGLFVKAVGVGLVESTKQSARQVVSGTGPSIPSKGSRQSSVVCDRTPAKGMAPPPPGMCNDPTSGGMVSRESLERNQAQADRVRMKYEQDARQRQQEQEYHQRSLASQEEERKQRNQSNAAYWARQKEESRAQRAREDAEREKRLAVQEEMRRQQDQERIAFWATREQESRVARAREEAQHQRNLAAQEEERKQQEQNRIAYWAKQEAESRAVVARDEAERQKHLAAQEEERQQRDRERVEFWAKRDQEGSVARARDEAERQKHLTAQEDERTQRDQARVEFWAKRDQESSAARAREEAERQKNLAAQEETRKKEQRASRDGWDKAEREHRERQARIDAQASQQNKSASPVSIAPSVPRTTPITQRITVAKRDAKPAGATQFVYDCDHFPGQGSLGRRYTENERSFVVNCGAQASRRTTEINASNQRLDTQIKVAEGVKTAASVAATLVGTGTGVSEGAAVIRGAYAVRKIVVAKQAAKSAGATAVREVDAVGTGGITNPGIIYKRTNPETGETYIGQAKSLKRFVERQAEHDRNQGIGHDYEIINSGVPKKQLDFAEEAAIREHGGIKSEGGTLANRRHQMSDERFRESAENINNNSNK